MDCDNDMALVLVLTELEVLWAWSVQLFPSCEGALSKLPPPEAPDLSGQHRAGQASCIFPPSQHCLLPPVH